jgi:translation initiation factor 1A
MPPPQKKSDLTPEEEYQRQISRIRLPKGREVLGVVEKRMGGSRMEVRCSDGKTRSCRIPGRMKRYLWVRQGDYVIIEPWEYTGETKGDVLFKYTKHQVAHLNSKGFFKSLESFDEF